MLYGHTSTITKLLVTRNKKFIISIAGDNLIGVWEFESKRTHCFLKGHQGLIVCLLLSRDDSLLLSGGYDGLIILWNLINKTQEFVFSDNLGCVRALIMTHDEQLLISASCSLELKNTIKYWNLYTRQVEISFTMEIKKIDVLAITPDDHFLITPGEDFVLNIWNLKERYLKCVLRGHTDTICVIETIGNNRVVSAGEDYKIYIWDIYADQSIYCLAGHTTGINYLKVTDDLKFLISIGYDYSLKIWDLEEMRMKYTIEGLSLSLDLFCTNTNSNLIFFRNRDIILEVIDIPSKSSTLLDVFAEIRNMPMFLMYSLYSIQCITITHDDSYLIYSTSRNEINKINMKTLERGSYFAGHSPDVNRLIITSDKKHLISIENKDAFAVWDLNQRCLDILVQCCVKFVLILVFTRDNKFMVYGGRSSTITVWNFEEKRNEVVFKGHTDWVKNITVTGDSNYVISHSDDRTIRVWSIVNKKQIAIFHEIDDRISSIAICTEDRSFWGKRGEDKKHLFVWEKNQLRNTDKNNPFTCIRTKNQRGPNRKVVIKESSRTISKLRYYVLVRHHRYFTVWRFKEFI